MRNVKFLKTSIVLLFLFAANGVLTTKAQPTNLFSNESCVKVSSIADCFPVIHWDYAYSDTIFLNTTDSVIAIHDLPGKDVFFLNFYYKIGFIGVDLICQNDSNVMNNLPRMERKISEDNWEAVSLNQQKQNKNNFSMGISEKGQLAKTWFKLIAKKGNKSLVIVIIPANETIPGKVDPALETGDLSKVMN